MQTIFKKNGDYTAVIIPEDEIETGVLKLIAKGNPGVICTTQKSYMLEQEIPAGSLIIRSKGDFDKPKNVASDAPQIESA